MQKIFRLHAGQSEGFGYHDKRRIYDHLQKWKAGILARWTCYANVDGVPDSLTRVKAYEAAKDL